MLHIQPKGWFSWDFRVLDAEGATLTEIDRSWLRERGTFEINGTVYTVLRTSRWKSAFQLEQPEGVLADATKPSAFRRAFDVETPRGRFRLQPASAFGRSFDLYHEGTRIGTIIPTGFMARSAEVDLPEALPLPIRVFLVFLVVVLWKRAADAAAAGS